MPNYLRNYAFGGCYFFTLVTDKRIKYFQSDKPKRMVLSSIMKIITKVNFELLAYCILPDHIHLLCQLPEDECNFSNQIREIKRLVTLGLKKELGQGPIKVWQKRFWEHTIRDENDLERHLDYIHYNPVKHGYVEDALEYKWSSYPELVLGRKYQADQQLVAATEIADSFFGE
jgi:putative transposase